MSYSDELPKDIEGNELYIGDEVFYATHSSNLIRAVITNYRENGVSIGRYWARYPRHSVMKISKVKQADDTKKEDQ